MTVSLNCPTNVELRAADAFNPVIRADSVDVECLWHYYLSFMRGQFQFKKVHIFQYHKVSILPHRKLDYRTVSGIYYLVYQNRVGGVQWFSFVSQFNHLSISEFCVLNWQVPHSVYYSLVLKIERLRKLIWATLASWTRCDYSIMND